MPKARNDLAIDLGDLRSLPEARAAVRNSFEVEEYLPVKRDCWDEAYAKWLNNLEA